MKIPKNKPINNSVVLIEQARVLSEGPSTSVDDELQLRVSESLRGAIAALEAESVGPIMNPKRILPGTIADPEFLNQPIRDSKQDLEILNGISKSLRKGMLSYYNAIALKESDVIGKLKTLRSKIATLKLYARNLDSNDQYVAFSFTDGSEVGAPDSGTPATYSEEEGALLLPCSPESIVHPEIASIQILPSSNGALGNSLERSRSRHADPALMMDGQTHTWMEYEKTNSAGDPFVKLDLRVSFKTPTIINNIRVNPANLGTANWVKIKDIQVETSEAVISIKDDISTPNWEPGADPFKLAPASSKFAGQGVYTFNPVLAKAVQISFVQDESYPIGNKNRYAIGIRELAISQIPFSSEGSFVLTPARFSRPVRAIGFTHNVAPYDSNFIKLEYQVSADGGTNWTDIVPLDNVDSAKKEALVLDIPSDMFLIKGKITRDSSKFKSAPSPKLLKTVEQMTSIATSSTSKFITDKRPETFLELIRIGLGCSGLTGNPLFLGTIKAGEAASFDVPINIPRDELRLLVNGVAWHLGSHLTDNLDAKTFLFDDSSTPNQIIFGDGVLGRAPTVGAEVYVYINTDRKAVFSLSKPYTAELSLQSDKIVETTRVVYRDLERRTAKAYAGPGQNKIVIPAEHRMHAINYVQNTDGEYDAMDSGDATRAVGVGAYPSGLQDGRVEFADLAEGQRRYVTDWDSNTIFFAPDNGNQYDVEVEYEYTLAVEIPQKEWMYHPSENKIIITSDKFIPRIGEKDFEELVNTRVLNLISGLSREVVNPVTILKGSIQPVDLSGDILRVLDVEIPFQNGAQEFIELLDENKEGYFSVDYKKGNIYLPPGIHFPAGQIRFLYVAAEIDYGLGIKLQEGSDYSVNGQELQLTPAYLNSHAEGTRNRPERNRMVIRYDAFSDPNTGSSEREPFYSPVIRDIAVVGVSVDPRLGTLESL